MTATTDVPDLVESWAAAEQGNDVEALDRLLAGDFVGVAWWGSSWAATSGSPLRQRAGEPRHRG